MNTEIELFKNSPIFSTTTSLALNNNTVLTQPEVKVLYLMLAYPTIKPGTIANTLSVSPNTAYVYKSSLINKIQSLPREELIGILRENFSFKSFLIKEQKPT
ncbi:hypothetical protein [Piscirickettsia litoralis]|uniref:HTH luxR-type domain-containing protein n=1 Tax=Piscirickettsia litoralis TaxID=1891921 RepID=A0ABX3A6X2_9GAMM|nr:hypothetical protein [Piscirickettsia litoralis]ODN43388.1 hypothetical protein BGC07_11210 [Piscirickettsia litoralis]